MCGILGVCSNCAISDPPADFLRALNCISHRGPDMEGVWFDRESGIGLGHRRLSILDLSESGKQPMHSHNGRWVISYNGEIYNWLEIRRELEAEGCEFQTTSDTEVLLESISRYGLERSLSRWVGMFAFILWDKKDKRVWIGRDRFGEKPLYYAWCGNQWWIASELKSINQVSALDRELDTKAIDLFLRYKYVPDPLTVFKQVKKLPPATIAELKKDGTCQPQLYWNFEDVIQAGLRQSFSGSLEEASAELEKRLLSILQMQMTADVPVGAFLSGGIDSSLIVSLMQSLSRRKVHTFSIGFEIPEYDESAYAKAVAHHLKTEHVDLFVSSQQALDVIPELPFIYDEPYADSSAIPTLLVSRLARKDVTVSLSGDAGDELFGGYNRYNLLPKEWEKIQSQSAFRRRLLYYAYSGSLRIAESLGLHSLAQKLLWRKRTKEIDNFQDLYLNMMTSFGSVSDLMNYPDRERRTPKEFDVSSIYQYAMACDTVEYLPGDILTKVDRAAMSCSLETRIPFLDHRLVEWIWSLPIDYKITDQSTKIILRTILERYVPKALFERPKMGFGVPIGDWLRGHLRDWAESLLSPQAIQRVGVLDYKKVQVVWQSHLSGKVNQQYRLWPLLMLQAWHQAHMER